MNPRTIQVYEAAVSFLHHSLVYKSPASRNPMLRLDYPGSPTPPGTHSPQAYMAATDSGNAGLYAAEVGARPPQKTQSSDAQGSPYLWVLWFLEGQ